MISRGISDLKEQNDDEGPSVALSESQPRLKEEVVRVDDCDDLRAKVEAHEHLIENLMRENESLNMKIKELMEGAASSAVQ